MKRTIIFLISAFFALSVFGQSFEGKIVYSNTYKSKIPNFTDKQLKEMMGSVEEFYIKKGNYKTVTNGSFFQWQIYVNKDNKLYTKTANSDTLFWTDAAINPDEVLQARINKGVTEILGYKCDELILTCKSGIQKHYFNSTLFIDAKLFTHHKYVNWYAYLLKSNSLPLKSIIENDKFVLEMVATQVKKVKLDKTFFDLPANYKTAPAPY